MINLLLLYILVVSTENHHFWTTPIKQETGSDYQETSLEFGEDQNTFRDFLSSLVNERMRRLPMQFVGMKHICCR